MGWRGRRLVGLGLGLLVLAGLGAVPGAIGLAGVRSPWLIGGAAVAGAGVAALSGAWQERYKRLVQRSEDQARGVVEGCLVIRGRLPKVGEVHNPQWLGVRAAAGSDGVRASDEEAPPYIPRDFDDELRHRLAHAGFVLPINLSIPISVLVSDVLREVGTRMAEVAGPDTAGDADTRGSLSARVSARLRRRRTSASGPSPHVAPGNGRAFQVVTAEAEEAVVRFDATLPTAVLDRPDSGRRSAAQHARHAED